MDPRKKKRAQAAAFVTSGVRRAWKNWERPKKKKRPTPMSP